MKSTLIKSIVILLTISIHITAAAQDHDSVRVTDFGLKPGSRENAVRIVQRALEHCKTKNNPVLIFPKGRYDFWPQYAIEKKYYESNTDVIEFRRCAILIEDMKDLTVDCKGSEFVFHDRIQPFTLDKSQNITILNVSIDWDIPLTAQGEIMEVTDQYIDLAINVLESPYVIEEDKLVFVGEGWKSPWGGVMEFDRETKYISPQTGDPGCLGPDYEDYKAQELKYGLVRLTYPFKRKLAKGNYLVLRHNARDHAGMFIIDSKNITVQGLNMYHTAGLGILSQYSENLTFRHVNSVPNPKKNRVFAGHDDGFHYANCKGSIVVDSCRFFGLMDDPINVHGAFVKIIERKNSNTLVCKFMHHQSVGLTWARRGERVGFVNNGPMITIGYGIVESFKAVTPELFEISFREPVPETIKVGYALENVTWIPDVLIRNSFFGSNRARGILVSTAGKIVIENNIFESSGSAILIAGDANNWYESGAVTDVLIRNNTFNDPCMTSMYQFCEGIISIDPEVPAPDPRKPFHKNIRIENNTFHPYDFPVLYARSVDGLSFTGNKLIRSYRFKPFHKRTSTFTLENCMNVQIGANTFEGDILGKNIRLINTDRKTVKVDKKQKLVIEQ